MDDGEHSPQVSAPLLSTFSGKEKRMDLLEAMRSRHSVRAYEIKPIPEEVLSCLQQEVDLCNQEGNLHIQLAADEPQAFDCAIARYGNFSHVRNYFALAGPAGSNLEERAGYYGERLVLLAQTLGLNTCWVGLTFSKKKAHIQIEPGEKLALVIAFGYGKNQGVPHKDKPMEKCYQVQGDLPEWFRRGMECAMLAPTAINQQKFCFSLERPNTVRADALRGPFSKVDLGIVKYHFELGAGPENFTWAC